MTDILELKESIDLEDISNESGVPLSPAYIEYSDKSEEVRNQNQVQNKNLNLKKKKMLK